MNAIDQAVALAKRFEGCKLTAYRDPAGIWTIGWGATEIEVLDTNGDPDGERPVYEDDFISQDQADYMLRYTMTETMIAVGKLVPVDTTPGQSAALADFAYNLGIGALRSSTLLRLVNAGDLWGAADQFLLWDKAHVDGKLVELPGLLARRKAERAAFLGVAE